MIGGAQIYRQFLPYSHKLVLTEIDCEYDADVFYPQFDHSQYNRKVLTNIEENGVHYQHIEYTKKENA